MSRKVIPWGKGSVYGGRGWREGEWVDWKRCKRGYSSCIGIVVHYCRLPIAFAQPLPDPYLGARLYSLPSLDSSLTAHLFGEIGVDTEERLDVRDIGHACCLCTKPG